MYNTVIGTGPSAGVPDDESDCMLTDLVAGSGPLENGAVRELLYLGGSSRADPWET